ncbi:phosphoribosyltransferase domain-containing protein [Nakamurella endophytica]|uniref:phosphoribosyltransferase domain-containing protein n=1 Tax=Nakamurella endophytica TaxID=1748367 RepID=UPI0016671F83|nr:phosphoribosyltransferase domain-containing protein [Nakamurella endophytica]
MRTTFGVRLQTTGSPVGLAVDDLVRLALRHNPRRAHLLVSTVLGKHLPVHPDLVTAAGRLLGALVARELDDPDPGSGGGSAVATAEPATRSTGWTATVDAAVRAAVRSALREGADPAVLLAALPAPPPRPRPALVLGYAETATALGHLVADQLHAEWYLHSTRRAVPGVAATASFEEAHSHATTHLLLPQPPAILDADGPLVLVDDELSTGATALATIRALQAARPRDRYVVASLVDLRSADDVRAFDDLAAELGARIDAVSLVRGRVDLPPGLAAAVAGYLARTIAGSDPVPPAGEPAVASHDDPSGTTTGRATGGPAALRRLDVGWPRATADGARHGVHPADSARLSAAAAAAAVAVRGALPVAPPGGPPPRVLVLGVEEFMYLPLLLARQLARPASGGPAWDVRYQSTTRSPVHPVDRPDYPVRRRWRFAATDRPDAAPSGPPDTAPRFLYNAGWPGGSTVTDPDVVVLVADAGTDVDLACSPSGPAGALAAAGIPVLAVRVAATPGPVARTPEPLRGPEFGSYVADDVGWLVTDLSHLDLEGDLEQRERLVQSGLGHYAESLPREYVPDAAYRQLFQRTMIATATRLATAVGVVTELVLAERGSDVVLASLARAGTPVGILMRRWAAHRHGLDLPHYAVSIVRGRGIDRVALRFLADRHDPARVVFVDGWTGKGAIARELTEALWAVRESEGLAFDDDLAVLADPGRCVRTFGTRDDFLIASACLNSTVSGLVSRTVLNPAYLRPDGFHGAKFYRELAGDDVSELLVDTVAAGFDGVADEVARQCAAIRAGDRTVTFAGWAAVEELQREFGIEDVHFVKPGVGETTRVLLRRIPWRILLRERDNPDHEHLRLLAADRGVPVEIRPDLPYSCVGLIRPLGAGDRGEG